MFRDFLATFIELVVIAFFAITLLGVAIIWIGVNNGIIQ